MVVVDLGQIAAKVLGEVVERAAGGGHVDEPEERRAQLLVVGGELRGYDGLTRRGSPERLLISEWLLATEAPDEFVRRAAFNEQAFLRPAFRQPQGGRRAVALAAEITERMAACTRT